MLEISKYSKESSTYNLHTKLLSKIKLSKDIEKSNRENLFIKDICKRVEKSKTVLYVLKIEDEIIGFISLSATSIEDQPSVQVDYIFVSENYRGTTLEILDNLKPFKYLIELSINLAKKLKSEIGIRYLVLSPDNDDLNEKYKKVDFQSLNKDWMYLKI